MDTQNEQEEIARLRAAVASADAYGRAVRAAGDELRALLIEAAARYEAVTLDAAMRRAYGEPAAAAIQCGIVIPLSQNSCTRPRGHSGACRCSAGDVDDREAKRGEWSRP